MCFDPVREEPQSPPSDNDGGERPVRQQLKQTSIQSAPLTSSAKENGRKRSFDESRDDQANPDENGEVPRKRSREGTPQNENNIEVITITDSSTGAKSENVSDNVSFPVLAPLEMADKTLRSSASPRSQASNVPSVHDPQPIVDLEADCQSEDWKSELDKEIAHALRRWRDQKANKVTKRVTRTSRRDEREDDSNSDAEWVDIYQRIQRQVYKTVESRRSSSPPVRSFPEGEVDDFRRNYSNQFYFVREYLKGLPDDNRFEVQKQDKEDDSDEEEVDDEEATEEKADEEEAGEDDSEEDDSKEDDSQLTPSAPSTPSGCSRSHLVWDYREEKWTPAGQYPDLWARYCRETKANKNLQDLEPSTAGMDANDESTKSLNKKRSREQLEDSFKKSDRREHSAQGPPSDAVAIKSTTDGEPEKKRHRDNSQEPEPKKADNGFASSAFGKAVGASPFASLESNLMSKKTSSPAFADSSFSSYASVNSPFLPPTASKPSVFMSASAGSNSFTSAPPTNTLASAPATSGFGAMGGGFAGFGGGFAAAAKPGLTSFASSNAPPTFGETKAKPLGAADSEDDESDEDGDEDDKSTFEAAKTDDRFYEQTIETGEEEEETVFSCKAKLFHFSNREWKERGLGTFKVNVRQTADGNEAGRMIMRADGAGRVMLNSPIFKGMNYGGPDNAVPTSKQILLASTEEGRTVPLLLRTQSEAIAVDLYDVIDDLLTDSSKSVSVSV
ncbi:hypothetical protein N7540_008339 [Penicillium herquei]|nr:hypothetical protein N7540_008339 [Penicillium herquei]